MTQFVRDFSFIGRDNHKRRRPVGRRLFLGLFE